MEYSYIFNTTLQVRFQKCFFFQFLIRLFIIFISYKLKAHFHVTFQSFENINFYQLAQNKHYVTLHPLFVFRSSDPR